MSFAKIGNRVAIVSSNIYSALDSFLSSSPGTLVTWMLHLLLVVHMPVKIFFFSLLFKLDNSYWPSSIIPVPVPLSCWYLLMAFSMQFDVFLILCMSCNLNYMLNILNFIYLCLVESDGSCWYFDLGLDHKFQPMGIVSHVMSIFKVLALLLGSVPHVCHSVMSMGPWPWSSC